MKNKEREEIKEKDLLLLQSDICLNELNILGKDIKEEQFKGGLDTALPKVSSSSYEFNNGLDFYIHMIQQQCKEVGNLDISNHMRLLTPSCTERIENLLANMESWVNWYAYRFEFMTSSIMGIDDVKAIIRFSIVKSIFKFDFDKKVKFKTFVQKVAYNDVISALKKYKSETFFF